MLVRLHRFLWGFAFFLLGLAGPAQALTASINLRASSGQWVSADQAGATQLVANRNVIGPWETFTLDDLNGGTLQSGDEVSFRAVNNRFVTAEGGGGGIVIPNRARLGPWEKFRIHKINGSGLISSGDRIALQASNSQYLTVTPTTFVNLRPPVTLALVFANRSAIGTTERFTITINWSTALAPPMPLELVVTPAPGGAPATLSAHATDADGDLDHFAFWYQSEVEPWWHLIAEVAISGADAQASTPFIPPVTHGRVSVHVGVYDESNRPMR